MRPERTSQKNAADVEKINAQGRVVRERERLERNDLATAMSTKIGRRVLWRMLTKCRVFESIYETNARIHFNAGQQDIGHWLMAEMMDADQQAWLAMQAEANARKLKDAELAEAGQMSSAGDAAVGD